MSVLYRVVSESTWQQAQQLGHLPLCGNDRKERGIHLNLPEAVEYTINRYFSAHENPRVLVVNTSLFAERIEWRDPIELEPWQRPLARIDNLPLSAVIDTNPIKPSHLDASPALRWVRS
ncbi:DUF952 domain-containing protein [Aeromonas lusitana]|uniref:DUF952 domain-containing protein n=1 Tax=Aeromonas lusitana TaxID=931529 RepID=A0A2M8H4R3_9GAMM|nr:DUF952 domain-containing protein [Aeromonas lusitana]